jgi:sugar lactone lactonase YvrE
MILPVLLFAIVEHVAGGGAGAPGVSAKEIKFVEPFGIAFDKAGNSYVIEFKGSRLIKLDPKGRTSLLLGENDLHEPHGLLINRAQQLFIADTHNNRVQRIDLKSGRRETIAGNGENGYSGDGGPATKAAFNGIFAIDLNPQGDRLYITDLTNRRIRVVNLKSGIVNTLAGNGQSATPADDSVAADGPLVDPRATASDDRGNVYILERRGNALRVVDKSGRIRTLIKPGDIAPDLNGPKHLCIDKAGDVIIADAENHLVRKYIVSSGRTIKIAGTGVKGDRIAADDPLQTQLNRPHGVYAHSDGYLYITDSYNHRILRMK